MRSVNNSSNFQNNIIENDTVLQRTIRVKIAKQFLIPRTTSSTKTIQIQMNSVGNSSSQMELFNMGQNNSSSFDNKRQGLGSVKKTYNRFYLCALKYSGKTTDCSIFGLGFVYYNLISGRYSTSCSEKPDRVMAVLSLSMLLVFSAHSPPMSNAFIPSPKPQQKQL